MSSNITRRALGPVAAACAAIIIALGVGGAVASPVHATVGHDIVNAGGNCGNPWGIPPNCSPLA